MAFLSAILSLLSRKLGDLIQAVFGWSITALFGRLPRPKQLALSAALILSILWPVLCVGVVFPGAAAWVVAFLPIKKWLGGTVLRVLWATLAVTVPLIVGAITAWVAPDRKQRGGWLRTVLSGYPITLGFAISFLITFVVVPAIKVAALLRRWEDEHVYMQVKEDGYPEAFRALTLACKSAGVPVREEPIPLAMALSTRVMKWFARGGLDPVVPDHPRMLRGAGVALYLYPADLLLRGERLKIAHVRAALLREVMRAPAYMVEDPKAQKLEDQIDALWDEAEAGPVQGGRERLAELTAALKRADIPYEDGVFLYCNLLHLERRLCHDPGVVDAVLAMTPQDLAEPLIRGELSGAALGSFATLWPSRPAGTHSASPRTDLQ